MNGPQLAVEEATTKSFEDARQETLECGFLLACYQTLILAMRDRRLQFKHRAVLAVLIEHMNRMSCMTWIGRDRIATELGLAVPTVANALTDLSSLGYILAENRRTPETANRSLRHYTLARLSKEEIEQKLTEAIALIKSGGPKTAKERDHSPKITAGGDIENHRPQGFVVGLGNQKSPPAVDESHRRQWTVTNRKELISDSEVEDTNFHSRNHDKPIDTSTSNQADNRVETAELIPIETRRRRAKKALVDAKSFFAFEGAPGSQWGVDAVQYGIDQGFSREEIRHQGDRFKNFNLSKGNAYADWLAAWRNWLANARQFQQSRNAQAKASWGTAIENAFVYGEE